MSDDRTREKLTPSEVSDDGNQVLILNFIAVQSKRIADALELIAETMDCTRSDTMDELERIAEAIEAGGSDDDQGYPQ